MIVTEEFLKENNACVDGLKWFKRYNGDCEAIPILQALIADGKHDYANWLIVRCLTKEQCIAYAIFAAEQVLYIYEQQYPEDKRLSEAIEKIKKYLQSKEKKDVTSVAVSAAITAANAAANATYTAYSADAAYAATYAITDDVVDAAYAAAAAANAIYAAISAITDDVVDFVYVAVSSAVDAVTGRQEMKEQILEYGIELLQN